MPTSKTLVSLALLIFAVTSVASAGLSIYPADGPAPKIVVEQPKPLTYKVEKGDTVAVIAKSVAANNALREREAGRGIERRQRFMVYVQRLLSGCSILERMQTGRHVLR